MGYIVTILICVVVILAGVVYVQIFKKGDQDLKDEINLLETENKNAERKVTEAKEWKKKADNMIRRNNNHNHKTVESLIMDEDMPSWMNE